MKYLKYLFFSLCVLIAVFLTNELVKMQNADDSCFLRMEIQDLTPDTAERRIITLADLMRRNQLDYFFITENMAEANHIEIDVYFSSGEARNVYTRKWGKKEGVYKSMVSGKTEVTFHDDIMELAARKSMPSKVYQCLLTEGQNIPNLPYQSEYLSEHVLYPGRSLPYQLLFYSLWIMAALSLILLSVMEEFFARKELFIKLSYGYDYKSLLLRLTGREIAGVCIAFFVPYGLLFPFISRAVINRNVFLIFLLALCLDMLVLASPFYFLNFKMALGKGETNTKVLSFCYILRVLLIVISILMLSAAIQRVKIFKTCLQLDKVMLPYRGYICVRDASAGTLPWDERLVLDELMILTAGETRMYNVIVANENARQSLCGLISEDRLQNADEICVFLPEELDAEDIDKRDKDFLRSCVTANTDDDSIKYENYPSGKILYYLRIGAANDNSIRINDELDMQVCTSPVIVYVPGGCNSIYTNTVVFLKESDVHLYRGSFDIYSSYAASMKLYRIQTVVLLGISMVFLLFHCALRKIILKMEHSVNAMELCLKTIYGTGIYGRYQKTLLGSLLAHAIGFAVSVLFLKESLGAWLLLLLCVGTGLFAADILLEIREIVYWEKRHILSVLKGGAL